MLAFGKNTDDFFTGSENDLGEKDEAFCITAEADLWHTFDAVAMKSQHINVIIITIDIG